jgi:hypothetical protein
MFHLCLIKDDTVFHLFCLTNPARLSAFRYRHGLSFCWLPCGPCYQPKARVLSGGDTILPAGLTARHQNHKLEGLFSQAQGPDAISFIQMPGDHNHQHNLLLVYSATFFNVTSIQPLLVKMLQVTGSQFCSFLKTQLAKIIHIFLIGQCPEIFIFVAYS